MIATRGHGAWIGIATLLALSWLCGCGGTRTAGPPAAGGAGGSEEPTLKPDAAPDARPAQNGAPDAGTSTPVDGAASPDAPDDGPTPRADGPARPPGPGMLIQHNFKPKDTDPAIDNWLDDHIAIVDTRVPAQGKLYLFLAGGNGTPQKELAAVQEAAKYGFHALAIAYCTDVLVADFCVAGKDVDPDCSGKMRTEVLEGMDLSPHVTITPANSIENRLSRALVYLDQKFPAEGWGAFLDGAKARWNEVLVAGRSLGGSMVARVAQRRAVYRAEIHSAPGDSLVSGGAAPWLKELGLTPPDRIYAFGHTGDPGHQNQLDAWAALALPGAPTSVDAGKPPYGNSHRLITSAAVGNPHGSTTAGGDSPKNGDGTYKFAPVWRYMMGLP